MKINLNTKRHGKAAAIDVNLLNRVSRLTRSDKRRVVLLIDVLTGAVKFADPRGMYGPQLTAGERKAHARARLKGGAS
jgi:hypothetical protein